MNLKQSNKVLAEEVELLKVHLAATREVIVAINSMARRTLDDPNRSGTIFATTLLEMTAVEHHLAEQ